MIQPEPDRLTVAVIDEEFPFPANSGKRIRSLNLIQRLATENRIVYIAHQNLDPAESHTARNHLHDLGIETIEVVRPVPSKSGLRFFAGLFANLFSRLPYSVASNVSSEMKTRLQALHGQDSIQLWHCEWTPYAELFRGISSGPVVVAAHNVESLIWQRYSESEQNPVKRWYIRRQWKKFEKFERWAFSRANRTITVSDEDARLAEQSFGCTNTGVVPNGVDIQRYRADSGQRCPTRMVFPGSLDWRPNLDGIRRFMETALPAIVAQEPDARLTIVGRNPPAWLVDQIEQNDNIELHANVPDIVPYLSSAGMMVVPLRIGGGSRLKIIEAAANGLPVVSTRVGAEGLKFQPGRDYFVADSIEEMVEPVLRAMRARNESRVTASNAQSLAEQKYDWDVLAKIQSGIWRSLACPAK